MNLFGKKEKGTKLTVETAYMHYMRMISVGSRSQIVNYLAKMEKKKGPN